MYVQPLLLALKCNLHAKYEKPIDNVRFCNFLKHWTYFVPNFVPIPYPLSFFFAGFQWNILGYSISINNFTCNPVEFWQKIGKASKNCHFWAQLVQKRDHYGWVMTKTKNFFFRNNKQRSFRNFLSYQNIICFDWVMFLYLV